MKELICKNGRELVLCFKLLYNEGLECRITFSETENAKLIYHIWIDIEGKAWDILEHKFKIQIS